MLEESRGIARMRLRIFARISFDFAEYRLFAIVILLFLYYGGALASSLSRYHYHAMM